MHNGIEEIYLCFQILSKERFEEKKNFIINNNNKQPYYTN